MFILIIEANNISRFNMLRLGLWLFYISFDKDHKMFKCFHSKVVALEKIFLTTLSFLIKVDFK